MIRCLLSDFYEAARFAVAQWRYPPRPMVGLWATLSDEQKHLILSQGIEARSAEPEGLGSKTDSPVGPQADAPSLNPQAQKQESAA